MFECILSPDKTPHFNQTFQRLTGLNQFINLRGHPLIKYILPVQLKQFILNPRELSPCRFNLKLFSKLKSIHIQTPSSCQLQLEFRNQLISTQAQMPQQANLIPKSFVRHLFLPLRLMSNQSMLFSPSRHPAKIPAQDINDQPPNDPILHKSQILASMFFMSFSQTIQLRLPPPFLNRILTLYFLLPRSNRSPFKPLSSPLFSPPTLSSPQSSPACFAQPVFPPEKS